MIGVERVVVALDPRRPLPCPHCDVVFPIRLLVAHIDGGECPVLEAKKSPTARKVPMSDPLDPRREHHVGNVVPLRKPVAVNPRHPSLYEPPPLFDQDDPDIHAADRCVLLTAVEAQAITGVLRHARGHCPSPAALDQAIALLDLAAGRDPREVS